MSADELNFKKLSSEKYRIYRLLQSPSSMVETYRLRIKAIGHYRGAVIFPEQFISLYGQSICKVSLNRGADAVSASAEIIRNFSISGHGADGALRTFDEVLESERQALLAGDNINSIFKLARELPKDDLKFYGGAIDIRLDAASPVFWFSNKADGLSFLRKNIKI